jgi:flagellar hook protein FlgE
MAIQGNGFFALQTQAGTKAYSRAGNFTLDVNSNLVNPAGYNVLGWLRSGTPPSVNNTQTPSTINLSAYQAIAATPSTTFGFTTNLDAGTAVGATFPSSVNIYDSLGNAHTLQITYTKSDTNTWDLTASNMAGAGDLSGWTSQLVFNQDGSLASSTVNPIDITWTNGAADQSLAYNPGNMTQSATGSQTSASSQDGMAAGTLNALSVSQKGELIGAFTNGQNIPIAQVAMAMFTNVNGLQKAGNNSWTETLASGAANLAAANQGGRGYIQGNSLELSNVDTATELTQMIVSQQGYQANSRVITTANTLLQEVLNLVR